MKTANCFLVVEIMNGLVISVANFDEIVREFACSGLAFRQEAFEIASMPANRLAQLRQFA